MSPPSAEDQVQFLIRFQRLLDEGSFVATYKLALLLALAQASVEQGDDSSRPLTLTTRQLAGHFLRFYWRQAMPYVPAGRSVEGRVLKQNQGRQAAILRELAAARDRHAGSLQALMRDATAWSRLLRSTARTIEIMPLWRLQRVGRQELCFLYDRGATEHEIVLRPGIAYCFRRFLPLIQDLVQNAWTRFVRNIPENRPLVGEINELGEFLFGSERSSLSAFHPILRDLQCGRCFYCERAVGGQAAVDHFIPWSRYGVDLGHNFVLAHVDCNTRKNDRLASMDHLGRWCERNASRGAELAERFDEKALLHDVDASWQITRWAYQQAEAVEAQVWREKDDLVALDFRWRSLPGMSAIGS
jgi:hypothetical protein